MIMRRCVVCQRSKGALSNARLYTQFLVPKALRLNIVMTFVCFVVTPYPISYGSYLCYYGYIFKNSIACQKTINAWISHHYINEVIYLYGSPRPVSLDKDVKFINITFKRTYSGKWELNWALVVLIILRQMDRHR